MSDMNVESQERPQLQEVKQEISFRANDMRKLGGGRPEHERPGENHALFLLPRHDATLPKAGIRSETRREAGTHLER